MAGKVENRPTLDDILSELGGFGKYQILTYSYIMLPIIFSAINNAQYIFNAADVNYRCLVPECDSADLEYDAPWLSIAVPDNPTDSRCLRFAPANVTPRNCSLESFNHSQTVKCKQWVYQSTNTIVAEFDLGCQDWKRTLVGTVHSIGLLFALPLTACISDYFGRRTAFILTAISPGITGLLRSFSTSYNVYIFLEFLEPLLGSGVYSTGFILALELVGVNRRVLGGNIISMTYAVGEVIVGVIAWNIPYWRTLHRVIYAPALLFIFYYFIVKESIRWLWSKGRNEDAKELILKAAKINNVELSEKSILALSEAAEVDDISFDGNEKKKSVLLQVLSSKIILTRLMICSFWWITTTLVYYGLSINSVSLSGNSYLNYILVSLIEIPGYLMSVVCLSKFGRKYPIMTAYLVCGVALVLLPFVPESMTWASTVLAMTGKLSVSMAFSSIYIYTSELFPTVLRHSLLGTCSMIGRIGSIAAPQTPLLAAYMASLPFLVFGAFSFTAGCLMLLTPETLDVELPNTVEEAETISKSK